MKLGQNSDSEIFEISPKIFLVMLVTWDVLGLFVQMNMRSKAVLSPLSNALFGS